jgi:hypothetical protein
VFFAHENVHEITRREDMKSGSPWTGIASSDITWSTATEIIKGRREEIERVCCACKIDDHDWVRVGEPGFVETI